MEIFDGIASWARRICNILNLYGTNKMERALVRLNTILGACVILTLSSANILAAESDGFGGRPAGLLRCDGAYKGKEGLKWKSVRFSFDYYPPKAGEKERYFVNIDGLQYGSGGYVYNSTQIVIHSPEKCLQEGPDLAYKGCLFVGVIDRVDGTFEFYNGDYSDKNRDIFFWSQKEYGKICKTIKKRF